jgi:hypothetical protein
MSILALIATSQPAKAGPFDDIMRTLKKTFSQPPRKGTAKRKGAKSGESPSPSPALDASGKVAANTPPGGGNTRKTTRASSKNEKSDYPYGTPVPGKKGFVTSPFAPDSGFIDVRDFPPGTPVKDPYTNKIFLTP